MSHVNRHKAKALKGVRTVCVSSETAPPRRAEGSTLKARPRLPESAQHSRLWISTEATESRMRPLLAIAVLFLATNNVVKAAVDCGAPLSSPCQLAQEEVHVLGACGMYPLETDTME